MQFEERLLEEIAYVDGNTKVTFRFMFAEAKGLSKKIVSEFNNSKYVALQTKKSPKLLTTLLGIWMADKVPVLFHPRFPAELVDELVEHVGIKSELIDGEKMNFLVSCSSPDNDFETHFENKRIASVVFTSGSTGRPKAVAHSFGNHFASALGAHENTPFQAGDRWAASLPMCHVGGLSLFFRSLIKGGTIVFPDKEKCFCEAIVETKATHLSLIPTQLISLLHDAPSFLEKLKVLLIGGAPMPDPLFDECIEKKVPIRLTYGMTETASQLATGLPLEKNCGKPLNYRSMKIDKGEIFVGGDVLFQGYIEDGELNPREGDWFATGDLGELDEEGNLYVKGRSDNMFISGGENIQPEQVEKAILNLGLFSEVYIVPVADEKYGFRPFLFVDKLVELEGLHNKLVNLLPKYMWPVGISALPEKTALKVSRSDLKGLAKISWEK